jgi:hypothetical protein
MARRSWSDNLRLIATSLPYASQKYPVALLLATRWLEAVRSVACIRGGVEMDHGRGREHSVLGKRRELSRGQPTAPLLAVRGAGQRAPAGPAVVALPT